MGKTHINPQLSIQQVESLPASPQLFSMVANHCLTTTTSISMVPSNLLGPW
jgi:hypothetical protein